MDVNELRRNRATWIGEMKALHDGAEGRDLNDDEQRSYDELRGKVDSADRQIKRAEEIEALGVDLRSAPGAAPKAPVVIAAKDRGDSELRMWERWLRTGDEGIAREMRASNDTDMNIGTAADGGYAVPTGHYNQIIARRDEAALPMQVGVMRITGRGTTINVPVDNEADGEFVATTEANAFDRDAPALAQVALTKLMYTKQIQLSYQLLGDEDSNLLDFISDFVGRGLAKTYNSLFITEALANGTASLTFDSATTIAAAEIPELYYKQQQEYADGSVWIMNRTTEGIVRGLTGNPFLFVDNPAGTMRPEIWGKPVYNTAKMSAAAASVKSVLFGNFRYMGMYEDPGLTFMRDPYSLAYLGQVRLLYHFRIDFGVLQAEAIHYATHPTA